MELGLAGKVALVTGSSRGIGAAIAEGLAAEGCDVMLTGRDEAALKEVAAAVAKRGRQAQFSTLDLSDAKAPAALVADLKKHFGRLDILVNNAGATKRGDFRQLTDADWKDGFELKFFAHVRMSREAWPLLVASKGSVITIAGIGGKEPEAEFGIGSSVNAACVAWTKALGRRRQEGGRAGQYRAPRAGSRPSGCGGASAPASRRAATAKPRCARNSARSSTSPASAWSRTSPA